MFQVKNGDLDKLGLLFERYYMRLYSFFYRLTQNREASEDLVQGVFERILKYRSTYSGDGKFETWIFRIARNLQSDDHRRTESSPIDAENADLEFYLSTLENNLYDPEKELNQWLVRQAMKRLDPEKKKALILSRFEGFRYREIAEIMGCSESAVKVRIFRALQEMKEIITNLRKQVL
ncbi:MAG: RNA polymerase sigma factor [Balneolaceae bacterium]